MIENIFHLCNIHECQGALGLTEGLIMVYGDCRWLEVIEVEVSEDHLEVCALG